jgi:phosphoglycerol transferase MdoB-like AlkP superfamily enzyme
VVYPLLGFDRFLTLDSLDDGRRTLGWLSDETVFDAVLRTLRESPGPQFIFAVTLATHHGYDGALPDEAGAVEIIDGPGPFSRATRRVEVGCGTM